MHRVTDYYGPVIYSHFADRGSEYVPDSQQQVYGCFFDDLDEAADILAAWVEEQPEAGEFSRFDLLLDGSYTAWLRFANSLRLSLIHICCGTGGRCRTTRSTSRSSTPGRCRS